MAGSTNIIASTITRAAWCEQEDKSIVRAAQTNLRDPAKRELGLGDFALDRCRTVQECVDRYAEICSRTPHLLTPDDAIFVRDCGEHAGAAVMGNRTWFEMTFAIEDECGVRPSEAQVKRWFHYWLADDERDGLNLGRAKREFHRLDTPMYTTHDADIKSFDVYRHLKDGHGRLFEDVRRSG